MNSVARQLTAKAQSWGQVAKQLSGMGGKIALSKTEKISVHQAFIRLGVHTKSNKYTAQDLGLAWSERLKEGKAQHTPTSGCDNSWRCPLIAKAVPFKVVVNEDEYTLYDLAEEEYKAVKVQTLCRVVSNADKEKGSGDVTVTAQVVLRGLVQSIFVDDTLKSIEESKAAAESRVGGYINIGEKDAPNYVAVQKTSKGWKHK